MSVSKRTLVLGASENPDRYSNLAIQRLRKYHHEVVAIGNREGKVLDVGIQKETEPFTHIDTVTLYLNPTNQKPYYEYILSLAPKRLIFNPGTENPELKQLAEAKGIEAIEACTLVLLSTGQY